MEIASPMRSRAASRDGLRFSTDGSACLQSRVRKRERQALTSGSGLAFRSGHLAIYKNGQRLSPIACGLSRARR